jgi:hypothetical protein
MLIKITVQQIDRVKIPFKTLRFLAYFPIIKEACIDALILRFDTDVPELFYHHGKRQVVEVRAKKYSLWHIYLNNAYVGSIQYYTFTKQFNYHLEDNCLLTDDHVQKYIVLIQRGELKWIKDDMR